MVGPLAFTRGRAVALHGVVVAPSISVWSRPRERVAPDDGTPRCSSGVNHWISGEPRATASSRKSHVAWVLVFEN
jgi:hypothetical protein